VITKLAFKLARAIADRAELTAEWTTLKVQQYLVYLAKTLIRFGFGCTVSAILAWYTYTHRSMIAAVLSLIVLGVSFAVLYGVASPLSLGLDWASEKWERVRKVFFAWADIIMATVLSVFYVMADRLYELPGAFIVFFGILTVFFVATILPKSPLVAFAYGRRKIVVIVAIGFATIYQHVLTPNQRDAIDFWRSDTVMEVSFHMTDKNILVDDKGTPLRFDPIDRDGKPIAHHGGYLDEGGWHIVVMHAGEKEVRFQGRIAHELSDSEIEQIRKSERKKAEDAIKAAEDNKHKAEKADRDKQEMQRKADNDARLKAQQDEQIARQQALVQQEQESERQRRQREADAAVAETNRLRYVAAERDRREIEMRRVEKLQEVSRNIAKMRADDEINKSPTTWPPAGFTANGVRRFETQEELVLVDAVVINADPPEDEKNLVYTSLNHPLQYGTYLYPSSNPRGPASWTVVKLALGNVSDVKDKEDKVIKDIYSLELKPKELEVVPARYAIIRPPSIPPKSDIFLMSDKISLFVKKAGSGGSILKELGAIIVGGGAGYAFGGGKGAAIGAGIGAVGGVAINKATEPAYSFKHEGKSFEIPDNIRLAFFIRR